MRRLRLGMLLALSVGSAFAQQDHARVAVPFYRPAQVMAGLHLQWSAPRAVAFEREALALAETTGQWCGATPPLPIDAVRDRWRATVAAWELLSTPAIGPLLVRRSPRQIDFVPTRPELIARAIERAPASAADMERIGTPAKGLPALEWLLWTKPVQPGTPGCAYAVQVAAEVAREAAALSLAFQALAQKTWDEEAGDTAFAELLNQWIGGLERLRWQQIDKPLREAASTGKPAALPRAASAGTAKSWARQWQALRELAVFGQGSAPAPGSGMVPLETYLRGRGLNALADHWQRQLQRTDRAMQGLEPGDRARIAAATRELGRTKALAEAELAPALKISIGFSDADGD